MKLAIVVLVCLAVFPSVLSQACTNITSDNVYYLTSFCDKSTACGITCGNCTWWYAADSQRFGCKSTLNCQGKGKSVNL
jgi:hypothetical protein